MFYAYKMELPQMSTIDMVLYGIIYPIFDIFIEKLRPQGS